VANGDELLELRTAVDQVHLAPAIQAYILAVVRATRDLASPAAGNKRYLSFGASPRASLALYQAAKALAWLRGLDFVSPSLVQEIAPDVLRHRVGLTYEAEAEEITTDVLIARVLEKTPVPEV
jgi:MoxR-like ATPase